MKKIIEDFLLIDELDLKTILIIAVVAAVSFPVGYWVVFAEFGWFLGI